MRVLIALWCAVIASVVAHARHLLLGSRAEDDAAASGTPAHA